MASSARKWLLTINSPIDKGYSHEHIKLTLNGFQNLLYYCLADEIGEESGLFHTHVYFVTLNQVRFTTVKKRFPEAHIDVAYGSSLENRDYVFKEGKWLLDPKGETNIRDSHEEFGEIPQERQGKRTDLEQLYDMIRNGMSNYEILEANPNYLLQIDRLDRVRKAILEEQYKNTWRDVDVTYVWGATGTGKTRGVKEQYGYANVYTVTDYSHPFDGYSGQDVILFEEYRSNIRIGDMLQYLDGYPVELPCRYANKVACYTKVFFCTNLDIHNQYRDIQIDYPETWKAFLRRINRIKMYLEPDVYIVMDVNSYMREMFRFFNGTPFDNITD